VAVGQMVTDRLRRLDKVAYVRFASVYREFKTLEDLVQEAKAVMDAQHYDLPGQGRLFLDPPKAPINGNDSNGSGRETGKKSRRNSKKSESNKPAEE
jgi:hypothetical protein